MQVSFIIPLYNCLAHTQECLRTLQATLPAALAHEIIFVDDGSTDGTRDWLATLPPPCRAVLNPLNLGFAGACNRGAAVATGQTLFFLNNDLVFLPGWFAPMGALLERPSAGLVGNIQLNHRLGTIDHAGVYFDHKGKPTHERDVPLLARLRGWRAVPALTGACFGIRRQTWHWLGGFDEGFRNGGEDIDLCLKARSAGLTNLVATRSAVRHHISASAGRKLRDEQNSCRLARRWHRELIPLTLPAWSAHALATRWDGARDASEHDFARELLFYLLRLSPTPPPRAVQGVRTTLLLEEARWRRLGLQ